MSTPEVSPRRKRMKLSLKSKETENTGSNEHDSANAQLAKRKENFMKACRNVSYKAYQDVIKRFQLIYPPNCINNTCTHGDRKAVIKQISRSNEQCFKSEIKNSTWDDALKICLFHITPCYYLSANVLKDIVEIIMNAHEDLNSVYPINNILRKCKYTLMIHFNIHPPCVSKNIRDCYKTFLTSPMTQKQFSNRKEYLSDEGIVSNSFSRLLYEISVESNDGALIEEQEIPAEIEGVKRLHWKKENLELFELLTRTERIERCMLVLECIIYLLQTDLALWHARCVSANSQMRSQKPLLANILWRHNCLTNGTVTPICRKLIELFAYFIHLRYPERHIKTLGLWMNTVIQLFYMYDRYSHFDYPNISSYCTHFAKEFHNIILVLPDTSISRILEKIEPSFMQYLVGFRHIQIILHTTNSNILNFIHWCVNEMCWKNYPHGDQQYKIYKKSRLKPNKLLDYLSKKCRNFNVVDDVLNDDYPKLELQENNSQMQQDYIIDILFKTFVAYLETYSIKSFEQTLHRYNENEISCEPCYKSYCVSDDFVKLYRSIIKCLQELLKMLKEKQNDVPSKKLLDLINVYFS